MLNKVGLIHHDTGHYYKVPETKSCDHGGMSSLMQLRFSDTFFIPLSLCFQSAIKVIGVCEYFDSMVKSDNCDLK